MGRMLNEWLRAEPVGEPKLDAQGPVRQWSVRGLSGHRRGERTAEPRQVPPSLEEDLREREGMKEQDSGEEAQDRTPAFHQAGDVAREPRAPGVAAGPLDPHLGVPAERDDRSVGEGRPLALR